MTDEQLTRAELRLNGESRGLACGVLGGMSLWMTTLWLVIKDGPPVGQQLVLLWQFMIGDRLTVTGSFIVLGGLTAKYVDGWLVAWTCNLNADWRNC